MKSANPLFDPRKKAQAKEVRNEQQHIPRMLTVDVQVPPGVGPGGAFNIDIGRGKLKRVAVPAGVSSGQTIRVRYPAPEEDIVQEAERPEEGAIAARETTLDGPNEIEEEQQQRVFEAVASPMEVAPGVIGTPLEACNITESSMSLQSSSEELTVPEDSSEETVALVFLTHDQVIAFLRFHKLDALVPSFTADAVDGSMLNDMETTEDIDELVVGQSLRKKKLLCLLQAARAEGVATECIEQTLAGEGGGGGDEALTGR
jgi:hypothetical protein